MKRTRAARCGAAIGAVALVLTVWASPALGASAANIKHSRAASSLRQECIAEATARPHIEHAEITHAGTDEQFAYAHVVLTELPSGCTGQVLRKEKFVFKIQNPLHRARWETAMRLFETFAIGNKGYIAPVYTPWDYTEGPGFYRCTPGPKVTGAKLEIRLVAQDPETHRPLAKKTWATPIHKILPKRC